MSLEIKGLSGAVMNRRSDVFLGRWEILVSTKSFVSTRPFGGSHGNASMMQTTVITGNVCHCFPLN